MIKEQLFFIGEVEENPIGDECGKASSLIVTLKIKIWSMKSSFGDNAQGLDTQMGSLTMGCVGTMAFNALEFSKGDYIKVVSDIEMVQCTNSGCNKKHPQLKLIGFEKLTVEDFQKEMTLNGTEVKISPEEITDGINRNRFN